MGNWLVGKCRGVPACWRTRRNISNALIKIYLFKDESSLCAVGDTVEPFLQGGPVSSS